VTYRPILAFALTAVAVFGLAAVSPAQPPKLSDDALNVAKSNNLFALDLYAQLGKEEGNLFFSPYSISSALSMTYAGAKGKTAQEMASTLHFSLPEDRLHAAAGELVAFLNGSGKDRPYQLSVANALWGQKGLNFLPQFLKLNETNYGAGLKEVDFVQATEPARKTINAWVEKQTNDKIKDLLKPGDLTAATRLVLTNAIYFKSPWQNKFWKESTKPEDFTLAAGTKAKVPMMHKVETTAYAEGGTLEIVAIPYKDHALSMVVLLPKKADGLPELEKQLSEANLIQWLKKLTAHQVDLKLPKFKVTSQINLKKQLSDMGMGLAFSGGADFSGMSTQEKLQISEVIHKAFVDVHEEGTEAAAATAVITMGGTAVPPPLPKVNFHVDRPFVYLILDTQSGAILFMGRVTNPKG
jgi:serpin B